MATISQHPGTLNIHACQGDTFSIGVDLSINTTGYSWTAPVYATPSGETLVSITVAVADAALGQINLSLTHVQTAALAVGSYQWELIWVVGGGTRTALAGILEVTQ